MTIQIGDRIPEATLSESTEFGPACPTNPQKISVTEALRGKRVVVFGLPGAFTPTCSAKHAPGYVEKLPDLRAKGVDEVWCIAANDGYVMAAWGRELGAIGKVRMLGDGSAELTKKLGLDVDIPGMGVRTKRFSMLVEDGVVKQLNVEAPGKFEVSDAGTMLKQLGLATMHGLAMEILRAAALPTMPWKNGGGTTTEIARSPGGTSLADFDWRVSRARVASDGPFSAFPGIDRTLLVIAGEGIRLDVATRGEIVLDRASEPFAFSGDVPVSATLVKGAVEDLNVMTRRGRFRHAVERRRIDRAAPPLDARGDVTLVIVVEGEAALDDVRLAAGDAVRCDRRARLALRSDAAQIVVVAIDRET